MKGQAEMIIVVGILIIAVVVVLATLMQTQPPPDPTVTSQAQKMVKDSFTNLATSSANEVILVMEQHGGYLSADILEGEEFNVPEFVMFLGQGVPYWHKCENDISPPKKQIESLMEDGIEIFIMNNINSLSFDNNVVFDTSRLEVSANILDDKIDYNVHLPTTVDGSPMQQPYIFSVPTRFGRIIDFAKDFSKEASESRLLEIHTLASMYFSPIADDGDPVVPTNGFLTTCGHTIFRSPQELSDGMKQIVSYSLASTLWWQERPIDSSRAMVYAVEDVNGNEYKDLEMAFYLPDDFGFMFDSPLFITNTEWDYKFLPPTNVPNCMFAYMHKYSIDFPVITSIEDDLTGSNFNIASHTFIENPGEGKPMTPGSCDSIEPVIPGSGPCGSLDCTTSFRVVDTLGRGIEGARAIFGGCPFGDDSDNTGLISGEIQCGYHTLNVYKPGYTMVNETMSEGNLGGEYVMIIKPNYTFNFRDVKITDPLLPILDLFYIEPSYSKCKISKPGILDGKFMLVSFDSEDYDLAITNVDAELNQYPDDFSVCENDSSQCLNAATDKVKVSYIPAGTYDIYGDKISTVSNGLVGTFTTSSYTLPPEDIELYLHTSEAVSDPPYYNPLRDAFFTDSERAIETQVMWDSCSIEPITGSEYEKRVTYKFHSTCACNNLRSIAEDVGSCLTTSVDSMFNYDSFSDTYYCTESSVVNIIENQCPHVQIIGNC